MMVKRLFVLGFVAAWLVALAAAPALAQQDPFDPAPGGSQGSEPESSGAGPLAPPDDRTDPAPPDDDGTSGQVDTGTDGDPEVLPNTGADVSYWLVSAYALLAAGAAALIVSRNAAPHKLRR